MQCRALARQCGYTRCVPRARRPPGCHGQSDRNLQMPKPSGVSALVSEVRHLFISMRWSLATPRCWLLLRSSGYRPRFLTPKWGNFGELLEVKTADPRAPVENAVCIIVFSRVTEGEVVHWINGH